MKSKLLNSAVFFSLLGFAGLTSAANIDMNADINDLAIKGYDPVSYFIDKKPKQGSGKYAATHKNAIYHFASAEHRDLFRGNPEKYAPQFGGYCAMGVALEKKSNIDPTVWKILDRKLYLNFNKSVQKKWLRDTSDNIKTALIKWPDLKDIPVSEL